MVARALVCNREEQGSIPAARPTDDVYIVNDCSTTNMTKGRQWEMEEVTGLSNDILKTWISIVSWLARYVTISYQCPEESNIPQHLSPFTGNLSSLGHSSTCSMTRTQTRPLEHTADKIYTGADQERLLLILMIGHNR